LGLFQSHTGDVLRQRLAAIDPNAMTPLEALSLLAELKREAEA
jgi:hypothetical protein